MENEINELIDLAQRLDSVMDDSESDVYEFGISRVMGRVSFFMDSHSLLKNFESVDVIAMDHRDFPFKIMTEVEGVIFESRVHRDELYLLKGNILDEQIDEFKNPKQIEVSKIRLSSSSLDKKSPLTLACE